MYKCEICNNEGIETEATYYRDLDEKPRPLCNKHAEIAKKSMGYHFIRHYVKINEENRKQ